MTVSEVIKKLENEKDRSAWNKGVKQYAYELLDEIAEAMEWNECGESIPNDLKTLQAYALNGAADWKAYSWNGSSLIYDFDIAKRLCNLSELKRTLGGARRPNSREDWLDVQARALYQAFNRICAIVID